MDKEMESNQAALEWLYVTVVGIVDHPDTVFIEARLTNTATEFDLKVSPEDIGKVIGKNGHNARALRTIFFAMGRKNGTRYELNILERGLPAVTNYRAEFHTDQVPATLPEHCGSVLVVKDPVS